MEVEESSHSLRHPTQRLLADITDSVQQTSKLVDVLTQKIVERQIDTTQGLSFLEMRNNVLLQYIVDRSLLTLIKSLDGTVKDNPSISRLVENRTVLEKLRPLERRLKYQINKLVKNSTGDMAGEPDPTLFKANPEMFVDNDDGTTDEDEQTDKESSTADKREVYKPPMLSAAHYEDKSTRQTDKRSNRLGVSQTILQELREEYAIEAPEISEKSRFEHAFTKQQEERRQYEEEYLTRLPTTKSEKHRQKQFLTMGTVGDEIVGRGGGGKKSKVTKNKHKKRRHR